MSIQNSVCEVRNRCWAQRPGLQATLQLIPKLFSGFEIRAMCRPLEFRYSKLIKPCLCAARVMHRGKVMMEWYRAFPKLLPQSRIDFTLYMNWMVEPKAWKTPPDLYPSSTKLYLGTRHSGRQRSSGKCHPWFAYETARFIPVENKFPLFQSLVVACIPPPQLTYCVQWQLASFQLPLASISWMSWCSWEPCIEWYQKE